MGAISGSDDGSAATRSISAFFDTPQAAAAARTALVEAGVSFEAVKITDGHGTVTGRSAAAEPAAGGPIDTLKNAFAQDRATPEVEQARPEHELTAHVPPAMLDQARAIIGREGRIVEQE